MRLALSHFALLVRIAESVTCSIYLCIPLSIVSVTPYHVASRRYPSRCNLDTLVQPSRLFPPPSLFARCARELYSPCSPSSSLLH